MRNAEQIKLVRLGDEITIYVNGEQAQTVDLGMGDFVIAINMSAALNTAQIDYPLLYAQTAVLEGLLDSLKKAGRPKCTCAKSNWDSLSCPVHGLGRRGRSDTRG